jgi:hypothetical protein
MNAWTGNRRADGAQVVLLTVVPPTWGARGPNGHVVGECPCCGTPIRTREVAQSIVDFVFPVRDHNRDYSRAAS